MTTYNGNIDDDKNNNLDNKFINVQRHFMGFSYVLYDDGNCDNPTNNFLSIPTIHNGADYSNRKTMVFTHNYLVMSHSVILLCLE